MPHYVKKLGRKNYWRKSRSVRVIINNCDGNFLGALAVGGNFTPELMKQNQVYKCICKANF